MRFIVIPNFSEAWDREGRVRRLYRAASRYRKGISSNRPYSYKSNVASGMARHAQAIASHYRNKNAKGSESKKLTKSTLGHARRGKQFDKKQLKRYGSS